MARGRKNLTLDEQLAKISTEIENILSLIIPKAFDLFDCGKIATKCWENARERKIALEKFTTFIKSR